MIEHTERVLETEKAAGKEELALENQLIVESRERERQRLHTEDAESKIKAELAVIVDNTAQRAERLRLQTTAHEQETDKSFHQRQNQLVSLLKKLQDQLSKTETTHSQAEIMLGRKFLTTKRNWLQTRETTMTKSESSSRHSRKRVAFSRIPGRNE